MHRSEHSCYAVAKNIPPFPRTGQLCIGNDFQRSSETSEVFRYRDFRAESPPAARIIPRRSHVSPSDLSDRRIMWLRCPHSCFNWQLRVETLELPWDLQFRPLAAKSPAVRRNRVNKHPPPRFPNRRRAVLAITWRYLQTCPVAIPNDRSNDASLLACKYARPVCRW